MRKPSEISGGLWLYEAEKIIDVILDGSAMGSLDGDDVIVIPVSALPSSPSIYVTQRLIDLYRDAGWDVRLGGLGHVLNFKVRKSG